MHWKVNSSFGGFNEYEVMSMIRRDKIKRIKNNIDEFSNEIIDNPGYVFVPYILTQQTTIITIDSTTIFTLRKYKIRKIKGEDVGTKPVLSRYSTVNINSNYYGKV